VIRTCRELALSLYEILVNFWHFGFYTLPHFEKFDSIPNAPESWRASAPELVNLHRNTPELSDLEHIYELKKRYFM
jgi:hypothetical protein